MATINVGTLEAMMKLRDELSPGLKRAAANVASTSKSFAGLADAVGKTSTTLARSVSVLGLNADALRALDDAADVAELGLRGVEGGLTSTVTASSAFSSATLGAVGAAAALGAGLGTLLLKIPAVKQAADEAAASLYKMFTGIDAAKLAQGPPGFDQAKIAAGHQDAIRKQIAAQLELGVSGKDLEKIYGQDLPKDLQASIKAHDASVEAARRHAEEIDRLAASFSGAQLEKELANMAAAVARAGSITFEAKEMISEAVGKAIKEGLVVPSSLIPIQQEVISKQLEEIIKGAIEKTETKSLEQPIEDLWKRVLGGGLEGGVGETAAVQDMVSRAEEFSKSIEQAQLDKAAADIERMKNAFQGLAMVAGLFSDKLAESVNILGHMVIALKQGADKFTTIANAAGQIGDVIGGKAGGALMGAAGGALTGMAVGGPIGAAIGGVLGGIAGLFGSSKKQAEELKRKQQEAIDAFGDLYQQWVDARQELAAKGAEGATSLIDTLFKDGKFTAEFTSAANAAEYVVGAFNALRASGLSFSQALAKIGPALTAMGKDAKQFAGTAAAPLIAMAKIAGENEKLLQFQAGLADVAVGLAAFNQLTQETATKMSIDMGASIDKLVAKGATYEQALGISAESLFKLQSAAQKGGVTLDAHTQKMIDDAQAAGLFDGLQDPMQKLIQATQAVVAAIGTMVQLLGGQVPAAVQRMIDEFNNAQINVNVNVNQTGPTQIEGGPPGPPTEIEHFQHGGFVPELPGYPRGYPVMVGEHGTGGEDIVPRRGGSMHDGGGDTYVTNVYAMPHQDERQIAEEANRLVRLNKRGRLTQAKLGHR